MHPFHELLHKLHANIENERDDAAEQAEGNQNHLDVVLNEVDVHGQLLNFGRLILIQVRILLCKVLVLHP